MTGPGPGVHPTTQGTGTKTEIMIEDIVEIEVETGIQSF